MAKTSLSVYLKHDQTKAFEKLKDFIRDKDAKVFILRGYAGTGKTTMMKVLIEELSSMNFSNQLLASTGRAAKILSDKTGQNAATVHGMIYKYNGLNEDLEKIVNDRETAKTDHTGQILINFELSSADSFGNNDIRYYIVDESSMVSDKEDQNATQALFGSGKLLTDLLQYDPNGKFIFVGDICQLPPVLQHISPALSSEYFKKNFSITPYEYELKEIIRQEKDNSIIESSKRVRMLYSRNPELKWIKFPLRGYENIKLYPDQASLIRTYINFIREKGYNASTLICQSNKNCLNITELIRPALNFNSKELQVGDLLLVTQNNYITGLMNGDMVEVTHIGNREIKAGLTFLKVEIKELLTGRNFSQLLIENIVYGSSTNLSQTQQKELFLDFFIRMRGKGIKQKSADFSQYMMVDEYMNALRAVYGYALTCHKSQGGEWDDVFIDIGKSIQFHERPAVYQWIYTAMTRAKKHLHIVDEWWIN